MDSKLGFSIFSQKCKTRLFQRYNHIILIYGYSCLPYLQFHVGFLVAEIFSRYYAREISMHSYDNGNSAKSKKDNWTQLLKVFRRIGLGEILSEEQSHHISCLEDGAAIDFLCRIYELLTQRKIQTQVKKPTVGRPAGYARDISLTKVRKALQLNDIRDDGDIRRGAAIIGGVVDEHERSLQEERYANPERFSVHMSNNSAILSNNSSGSRLPPGPPKAASELLESVPQVCIYVYIHVCMYLFMRACIKFLCVLKIFNMWLCYF